MNDGRTEAADFGLMPSYMGCVSSPPKDDQFHPMRWGLTQTGLLAVMDPPPLSQVYPDQHSEPTASPTWLDHHDEFADFFLKRTKATRVLEIGGGSGLLATVTQEKTSHKFQWTILEPCLPEDQPPGIIWIEGWFPNDTPPNSGDVLVATHVLEHATDPYEFLASCSRYLNTGGELFLSWPNMEQMAERGDLNMLNFEHLHFLPLDVVGKMLARAGFELEEVYDFRRHSIFLHARKIGPSLDAGDAWSREPAALLELASGYSKRLDHLVADFNESISAWEGEVSLFGAHIFSQYLIARGLNTERIVRLLDNSTHKQGHRLYGTSLSVHSPEDIRGKERQLIIGAAALYEVEILNQLQSLNLKNSLIFLSRAGKHKIT